MKKYLIRVVKYVIWLAVFFVIIFAFMNAVGGTNMSVDTLLTTNRGLWLLVVVFVFALLYPFFGFASKTLTVNAEQRAQDMQNVMNMCGYTRIEGTADQMMEFRANGTFRRLLLMYEDRITITTIDGLSTMSGPRKEIVKAAFRAGTFIQ